jgi:hypothetical protein
MTSRNHENHEDPRDLKATADDIDQAFDVEPLSAKGDESGLHNNSEPQEEETKETDGEVPVANLE